MKFKVGDKVVRTARCPNNYTVKQGCEYVISKVDDEYNYIYLQGVYDNNGQPDWFNHDNFELVEAVNDLEYVSEVVEQQKGVKKLSTRDYTDKSIFKVIDDYDSCFEVGDLVVIDSERDEEKARFKLFSEYGQYRKPLINWLLFEGLEYVGELGSDMVKENTAIQKDKAYRKMSPDTLIPISIDGNDFEVSLGGLLLARYIIGEANGSYLYSLYCALDVIDKEDSVVHFESQNPVDCLHYQKDLFSKYFKDEVKESKKLEIKAQIESLQEQLKTLD